MTLCALLLGVLATPSLAQPYAEGWQFSDIGAPVVSGGAAIACEGQSSCQVSLSGAGVDIRDTSDQFSFLHRPMTGDGVIIVRVSSLVGTDVGRKVGLMIRDSLAADSAHAMVVASSDKGLAFQRRRAAAGTSLTTAVAGQAPVWLKLERRQSSVIAYRSANGATWSRIGTDNIALGSTVHVGVALTSHNPAAPASAVLTDLQLPVPVPEGWATADVGGVPVTGGSANTYGDGVFTVVASGRDIGGSSDQFRFTYRPVSGDVDIVSRVASLEGNDPWAKAGVMVRGSLDPEAAHASLFMSRDNGVAFQRRPVDEGLTVHTSGSAVKAPAWLKLERRGEFISAYSSLDGALWSFVGEETLTLPSNFYVGLALTSHMTSESAKASFDRVSIARVDVPNVPPRVSLTASTNVTLGMPVVLMATASDSDGSVVAVDFVVGDTVIQSQTIAPFSTTWTPTAAGTYFAAAVARDNLGATTVSAQETVTVTVLLPRLPGRLTFAPSPDHATGVSHYLATVAPAATPEVTVATRDLGKPAIVNGEISVDVAEWITSLPRGLFTVTVSAVGPGGSAISAPSDSFAR